MELPECVVYCREFDRRFKKTVPDCQMTSWKRYSRVLTCVVFSSSTLVFRGSRSRFNKQNNNFGRAAHFGKCLISHIMEKVTKR